MFLIAWMLAMFTAADGLSVELYRVTGESVRGAVVRLDESGIKWADQDGTTIPLEDISRVDFTVELDDTARGVATHPDAWMTWIDGSRSPVTQVRIQQGEFHAKLLDGSQLTGPTRSLDAVRFYAPAPGTNQQWEALLGRPRAGDVVIVRKSAESLDLLEGVIHSVNDDIVEFEFDGQKIPVKRTKLEGIAFVRPRESPPKAAGKLTDRFGGQWQLAKFTVTSKEARLQTAGGVEWRWSPQNLRRLDLLSSNVVYLSDLEPRQVEWTSFFPGGRLDESFRSLFAVRKDSTLSGAPLELVGSDGHRRVFAKGLAIHSRTELTYRLPESYQRFRAVAGIDVSHRAVGTVQLTIRGDDRQLWSGEITGSSDPAVIDVSLEGVRRLTILVDYGDNADDGDHLILCDPKLIKSTK